MNNTTTKDPKTQEHIKVINIRGKDYVPVDERVRIAHKNGLKSITTEMLSENPVLFKATIVTDKGTFTGHSAANPQKAIEKASPYEVAETSAIGRALGFAGYGLVSGIATAEEMTKTTMLPLTEMQVGSRCGYCGKNATAAEVSYSKEVLKLRTGLCRFCQSKPERINAFKEKPGISGVDMGVEPSDEHTTDVEDDEPDWLKN